jgi:hypothetical protein
VLREWLHAGKIWRGKDLERDRQFCAQQRRHGALTARSHTPIHGQVDIVTAVNLHASVWRADRGDLGEHRGDVVWIERGRGRRWY